MKIQNIIVGLLAAFGGKLLYDAFVGVLLFFGAHPIALANAATDWVAAFGNIPVSNPYAYLSLFLGQQVTGCF